MKKIEIIPAILTNSNEELKNKFFLLKKSYSLLGLSEKKPIIQIDFCEEDFLKNFNYSLLADFSFFFDFEFDLMKIDKEKIKEEKDKFKKDFIKRIIFHYEDWGQEIFDFNLNEFKQEIGLAILPNSDISEIEKNLNKIDFLQFMGIDKVGMQGAIFNPEVVEKIKTFRTQHPEIKISVDGGVSLNNKEALILAGADRLVSGTAILGKNLSEKEISLNIKNLIT